VRKKVYKDLDAKLFAFDDNMPFLSIADILRQELSLEEPTKRYNDGIFSIISQQHINEVLNNKDSSLDSPAFTHLTRENGIFAALQDVDSKSLYFVFDKWNASKDSMMNHANDSISRDLLNNITSQALQASILQTLIPLMRSKEKAAEDFTQLENITDNYQDLRFLKARFERLICRLEKQIRAQNLQRESTARSDGGLFPAKPKHFKLIAWLLINPHFATLKGYRNE